MLNNMNNFFATIKAKMVKKQLVDTDLIAIGTKDLRYDGGYSPTAIRVEDFAASLPPVAVITDGVTITGNGTIASPLTAVGGGSSAVNYANVIFVDQLTGNNATGVIGRFDKPFATVGAASTQAATLTKTATAKALIYIRKGAYTFNGNLQDYLDYYSEPGVVFTSGTIGDVTFGAVNSNFYGYAKLVNTRIDIVRSSTCNFEFDTMDVSSFAIYIAPNTGQATINVKANYITSTTNGNGYAIGVRFNSHVTFDITRGIEAMHSTVAFRFFTGVATFNSDLFLGPGNIYGGNFKQALVVYDGSTTGSITVNGNIINKDTVDYGGIGSLVTIFSGANPKLKINGDIVGGPIKALDGNTQTNATVEINGDLSSDNLYTVWAYGGGELLFKNSVIKNTGVNVASILGAVNGTANIFFKDCYFYNGRTDSSLFVVNSATCKLVLDGCGGASPGTGGNSVYSSVGAVNIRANNSRFNKNKSVDITDVYSPSGLIFDTSTLVPTKIN
jgi:hypothetical protein